MIPILGPILVKALIERGMKSWLAKAIGWVIPFAIAVLLIWLAFHLFAGHFEKKGAAANESKHVVAHAAAVEDARQDERKAAGTARAIADATTAKNAQADAAGASAEEKIRHAIQDAPAPAVAGPGPSYRTVDSRMLAAPLDSLVDRANRAAQAPDNR
jgi:hypothetical protein